MSDKPHSTASHKERSITASKKWVAYQAADAGWTFLIGVGLLILYWLLEKEGGAAVAAQVGLVSLLMFMVVVKGFLQTAYIGGQAWLDRYIYTAEMALDRLSHKGKDGKVSEPDKNEPNTGATP